MELFGNDLDEEEEETNKHIKSELHERRFHVVFWTKNNQLI